VVEESQIFHESWYRLANEHICLRASVQIRRQRFRGSLWYVLHDPFNNEFFRMRPAAYRFVARLNLNQTVEEVWKEVMSQYPDDAPGQEDVIQLLAQLYHANLLHYDLPADSAKLFERYRERKQKIRQATLMSIMFFRIPLFDPDNLVKRLLPLARVAMSPFGAVVWIGVVAGALKVLIDNWSQVGVQTQAILAPTNLPLLYLALILIKTLHEFGHAFAVRRFGGEVHTMGVMFLIFNPLPYMDATAAWAFRSKWKRVYVGAAGMITEVFVAACAVFVWANTGPGVINALAYNMMFIASVSTVLFNINPLLRFDGYYILSDLLDIPNLHTQSSQHLRHVVERYALGYKKSTSPAAGFSEAFWLTVFGILSGAYKLVVFTTILLFVADRFLLAGIIMALVCAVTWVLVPLVRLVRYLASSPRLERTRLRAILVCLVAIVGTASVLYFAPVPHSFKSPGVLEAVEHALVVNAVPGRVEEILQTSGTNVGQGQPLVRLGNDELDFQTAETQASLREVVATRQKALFRSQADLKSIDSLISTIRRRLERLDEEREQLLITAEFAGTWVAPNLEDYAGMWIQRGTPIGQLVNEETYFFSSVVSQKEISQIFSGQVRSAEVRLAGQAELTLATSNMMRVPVEHTELPSVALGYGGGGEVAVDVTDSSGVVAAEPFYEVRLDVVPNPDAALYHGRSGRVCFKLPPEPLLRQGYRRLRQLLQERYQL
jgi:putative peptide zinc metalloprotease protein